MNLEAKTETMELAIHASTLAIAKFCRKQEQAWEEWGRELARQEERDFLETMIHTDPFSIFGDVK